MGQHAVLGDVGVVADSRAFLVATTAHDGNVELVHPGIRILRRGDVVGPVAGPAARRQGNTFGHADAVEAAVVDLRYVIVANGAVDILEFFIVFAVEILQIGMAIDALDVFPAVDGSPVLVDIHVEGYDPGPLVFRESLVIVAVQAVLRGLGQDRARPHQDRSCEKDK